MKLKPPVTFGRIAKALSWAKDQLIYIVVCCCVLSYILSIDDIDEIRGR
jgi:hypothetical protein